MLLIARSKPGHQSGSDVAVTSIEDLLGRAVVERLSGGFVQRPSVCTLMYVE